MTVLTGKSVCPGIAFGKLEILHKKDTEVRRIHKENSEAEIKRFEEAIKKASKELDVLYKKAKDEVGEENAMIFDIHLMMLEDEDFSQSVIQNIKVQKINAEAAILMTSDTFAETFTAMEDSYMQARAADVKDISQRLISILSGKKDHLEDMSNCIIAAIDLAPSETVQLDKEKVLAFVTEKGSSNSHTAILARTMDIPAVIGVDKITDSNYHGCEVIVDGFSGKVYIEPDMLTIIEMQEKRLEYTRHKELLKKLKGMETITKDGKKIMLYANIGSLKDMPRVYANDAMGVGLFRSEFIYLESKTYPTEDEQFAIYKSAAQKALGKNVIIRTLDIGADKQIDYFQMPKEDNPALGIRAIRICLSRPSLFKTQLRALYRATAFGKLSIMFPMITSLSEIHSIKKILKEVKEELKKESVPFNEDTPIGIMIETPAAAIISDILAKEVDFFSIGTNDLTQYTLAVDRQNPDIEVFCDIHHKAVMRLIKQTVDNGHKEGIWVGICGELAADPDLTELFLAMGVDELSVSPNHILPLKQKILNTNISLIKDFQLKKLD